MKQASLYFVCGKMGSGKTTLCERISKENHAILMSEDDMLSALYPGMISTLEDYIRYSGLLRPQIKILAQEILKSGVDVVLDFPANTPYQRHYLRQISDDINCPHGLYVLKVSNDVCLQRIAMRKTAAGSRRATDTKEMFHAVTSHFSYPDNTENLTIMSPVT